MELTKEFIVYEWICLRCGNLFFRDNEFSLFGYKQCLSCDYKMFEAVGHGEWWPESDKPKPENPPITVAPLTKGD